MPELAEVEFYRKRWSVGHEAKVLEVEVHPRSRIFRDTQAQLIARHLRGSFLRNSAAAAKQMLFQFSNQQWLGLHLGMTGELRTEPRDYVVQKHDHFVLRQTKHCLVFTDPRMFGRIQYHQGKAAPEWWSSIAPAVLSDQFTAVALAEFLKRRDRSPIKAVLLMQEQFPGIGNWMADEILWRSEIHPRRHAGSLTAKEQQTLRRECRQVCRLALRKIAGQGDYLPPDLNVHIPDTWLFKHRWRDGGRCPKSGVDLVREEIGGRTTCWSPARQSL
ncbi:MAG: DNA-formamidopyrimidine glycosylase [Opitutaceae bacterium]|jgi:formamidopyrimidine-DNA glycosylase|nr:DNA-formamidopyrimidine glycosylase [Opitutaceae bacterium]